MKIITISRELTPAVASFAACWFGRERKQEGETR